MILALVATAAVTRIDVVVTATGRLMSEVPPVVLQPIGSAVLRELRVRPGEAVAAGQVLAVLDSTFTAADRDALVSQRRALVAERDRLESELSGADAFDPVAMSPEMALQNDLKLQRRSFLDAKRTAIEVELDAIEASRRAEVLAGAGLAEQLAIATEVETMRARLAEDRIGSHLNALSARAARLQAEQDHRGHLARLEELGHRRAARIAERDAFLRDWERQVLEELTRVRPEIARLDEALAKAERLDALTHMRAPRDGVVLEVARRSAGSLVREGEPVVTLVPTDVPLIAEIALPSADIGRLRTGDAVEMKIDSFPWRRHGAIAGTLRSVSRESYAPEGEGATGPAMHRGQIAVGASHLRDLPPDGGVQPGMTLTADIKVGTRSVLGFFLEPIARGLRESLREP